MSTCLAIWHTEQWPINEGGQSPGAPKVQGAPKWLDGLALLAIENEGAKQLNIDDLLDKFANTKARAAKLMETSSF